MHAADIDQYTVTIIDFIFQEATGHRQTFQRPHKCDLLLLRSVERALANTYGVKRSSQDFVITVFKKGDVWVANFVFPLFLV